MTPRLLAFSGSARKGSYNHKTVLIAAEAAREAGADVNVISLRDFALPIYDGDLEAERGVPEGARRLKDLFLGHDGFLIASPEYNGAFSPLLKNAIDWVSRPTEEGETALTLRAYRGKVAGIMSASPGPWGGIRGLTHLRQVLSGIFVLVAAEQFAVPNAQTAFDETGMLKDKTQRSLVEAIGRRVAGLARHMRGG